MLAYRLEETPTAAAITSASSDPAYALCQTQSNNDFADKSYG
jgi:hypothetical protein